MGVEVVIERDAVVAVVVVVVEVGETGGTEAEAETEAAERDRDGAGVLESCGEAGKLLEPELEPVCVVVVVVCVVVVVVCVVVVATGGGEEAERAICEEGESACVCVCVCGCVCAGALAVVVVVVVCFGELSGCVFVGETARKPEGVLVVGCVVVVVVLADVAAFTICSACTQKMRLLLPGLRHSSQTTIQTARTHSKTTITAHKHKHEHAYRQHEQFPFWLFSRCVSLPCILLTRTTLGCGLRHRMRLYSTQKDWR